MKLKQKK